MNCFPVPHQRDPLTMVLYFVQCQPCPQLYVTSTFASRKLLLLLNNHGLHHCTGCAAYRPCGIVCVLWCFLPLQKDLSAISWSWPAKSLPVSVLLYEMMTVQHSALFPYFFVPSGSLAKSRWHTMEKLKSNSSWEQ